jgi:tetratricopeptide (TPR) repeat protein
MPIFDGLSTELMGAAIYDLGKVIKSKISKTEWVQMTLRKWNLSGEQHDFAALYLTALVELRYAEKDIIVLAFFREESIMKVFYNYYYGDKAIRSNEEHLLDGLNHCVEALQVGDDIKAANIDVETEVFSFWEVFKQKVQESRTVKEVEIEQKLQQLKSKTDDIHGMMTLFLSWMKQQGKTEIQVADKIYNIDKIDNAFFGQLLTKTPRFLTQKPFNTNFFIGRDTDLAAIETDYQKNNHLLVLVNGEGGMGKTTLAARYWFLHEARYTHLAWVFADRGIGNALISLSGSLGVSFSPNDNEATQIIRITEAINNLESPCLLVFDNANDAKDLEKHFVTLRRLSNCQVLLTSRVTALQDVPVHRVKPLDSAFAVQVFTEHYPKYSESDAPLLNSLLHAVGFNTLVIELLAKNLTVFNKFKTQYSLATLVADLQQRGLLAVQGKAVKTLYQADTLRTETPDSIIAAMYDVSALSDMERYLLNNFAILPAENIPYTRFIELLKPDNSDIFDDSLSSLQQKGWIDYFETTGDFKISPVIQHITKLKNKTTLLDDCDTLIDTLKDELHPDNIHKDNYTFSAIFSRYAETVVAAFDAPNYNAALLCERIGTYYTTIGNLDKALAFYEKERAISQELCVLQPDDEYNKNVLAISYEKLGTTHTSLGNLDKALGLYEEYYRLAAALYAANPNNVEFKNGLAISYQFLGNTHTSLGNLDKALGFYEELNKLFEELYAANPNNVEFKNGLAISYERLGGTHTSLGNLDKALGFYEESNRLGKELYAANPNNVAFKNGLAVSYSQLGRFYQDKNQDKKQARIYFEQCQTLWTELATSFPSYVEFQKNLKWVQGRLSEQ